MKQITSLVAQYIRDRFHSGDVITFTELAENFHDDFQGRKRSTLTCAMNSLSREYGMLFKSVQGVGYLPLKSEVSESVSSRRMNKIARQGKLFRTELETVAPVTLKTDQQVKEYLKAWHKCSMIEDAVTNGAQAIDQKVECSMVRASSDWKGWMKTRLVEMADVS